MNLIKLLLLARANYTTNAALLKLSCMMLKLHLQKRKRINANVEFARINQFLPDLKFNTIRRSSFHMTTLFSSFSVILDKKKKRYKKVVTDPTSKFRNGHSWKFHKPDLILQLSSKRPFSNSGSKMWMAFSENEDMIRRPASSAVARTYSFSSANP